MTTLPACRHRGREVSQGRYACSSNRLIHRGGSASAATCQICPYADRKNRRFQFGDWLASLFKGIGIKQKTGCGCHARQWKVNRWGEWFGGLLSTPRAILDKIRGKGD